MKTLVISENKSEWEVIKRILKASNPKIEVICAETVESAMDTASTNGPIGFFILDCDMREVDPNELGLNLVDLTGSRPFIFIGSAGTLNDRISQELFTNNSNNSQVQKPVTGEAFPDDINDAVEIALEWAKEEEFELALEEVEPSDYVGMKIKTFYLYNKFPHDIYLAITKSTYIKILSANKTYSNSTLHTYARKNVKYLYIKKDDQMKYLESEATKTLKALRAEPVASDNNYLLLLRAITIIHQFINAIGVTPLVLTVANAASDRMIDFYQQKYKLSDVLKSYPTFYEGIASKSLLTAFIAEGIGRAIGWDSITTKKKLALCAILHDISLPEETMSKINSANSPLLTMYKDDQVKLFLEHPIKAAEIAEQFTSFPDLDFIILNHHETPNRKGFPNKPSSQKLTQICSVFNVAQYIAAEIDGRDMSNELFNKTLKSMGRDYKFGVFKETLGKAKKVLVI